MLFRFVASLLGVAALACALLNPVSAAPRNGTRHAAGFELVDLSRCQIPRVKPPPMPLESDEEYGLERRYLALEYGQPCVLMESYVEALFGSHSSGMQTLGARFYRFGRGKWRETKERFLYFPYAVRDLADGQLYFVVAVLEEDVGVKYPNASGTNPNVFYRRRTPSEAHAPARSDGVFDRYPGPQGLVLQSLAVLLNQQLSAGSPPSTLESSAYVERKRIRFLLQAAWKTVPPAKRVAVDADGLPR